MGRLGMGGNRRGRDPVTVMIEGENCGKIDVIRGHLMDSMVHCAMVEWRLPDTMKLTLVRTPSNRGYRM